MKVVHLVAGNLNGGAARGAYWLHVALRELGVDSSIITNGQESLGDNSVFLLQDIKYQSLKKSDPQYINSFLYFMTTFTENDRAFFIILDLREQPLKITQPIKMQILFTYTGSMD